MPYEVDPKVEAQTASLFEAERGLNPEERAESKRMKAEAQDYLLSKVEPKQQECLSEEISLAERERELRAAISADEMAYEDALHDGLIEQIATGPACDALAIAGRIRTIEDPLSLKREAINLIAHVLTPKAREKTLRANIDLLQVQHLIANLTAILHHDNVMQNAAGLIALEGKTAIFGLKSAALRAEAQEIGRRWRVAEKELVDYQRDQAANEQTRMAHGLTRAEAVAGAVARRTAKTA